MKVVYPVCGFSHTSKDILPASCTTKPQVSCTSIKQTKVNEGLSNQEIYEGLVSVKNSIKSLLGLETEKTTHSLNYIV